MQLVADLQHSRVSNLLLFIFSIFFNFMQGLAGFGGAGGAGLPGSAVNYSN